MKCQICLREFKKLRFYTSRIKICGRCVQLLNEYHEVAQPSYDILAERYRASVIRNADIDLQSDVESIRNRARWTLKNIDEILAKRLPSWFSKIAADSSNTSKEGKILRAHRRGLLHLDEPRTTKHLRNFTVVGKKIKIDDKLICVECEGRAVELHTHHIIYKSNFGTDRKQNLITLCRNCHEKEHGRSFDFGEIQDKNASIVATEIKSNSANKATKIERKIAIAWESKLKSDAVNYVVNYLSELRDEFMLSGDGSGLCNAWEEICVQVQFEESFYWQAYQEVLEKLLWDFLEKLSGHEKLVLWSATNEGWNWLYDHREEENESHSDSAPLDESSVILMLMSAVREAAYVYKSESVSEFLGEFYEGNKEFFVRDDDDNAERIGFLFKK